MPEDRHVALDAVIDHAARQLAREAKDAVNDHPGVEDLVAYQEGRLAGDAAERLRRHLVDCPQCAREVLELEGFRLDEEADPALEPSPEDTAQDWAAFRRRVAATSEAAEPEATEAPAPVWTAMPSVGPGWWSVAAAAVLAAALGYWIAGLGRDGGGVPASVAGRHAFELDLLPDGEALIRDADPAVAAPAEAEVLLLRLHLGDQTPRDGCRAEILDAAGATVWSRGDLRRQPAGHFLLIVPRRHLPAGRYRLELTGATAGEETPLATYTFELRDAGDP